ncbi:DNA helicase PcrA [Halanaerocella petrolearia]
MDLSAVLNEKQREAVKTTEGPVLVLAGAGSGKTRALTYRIAYLIEEGVDPYNILTLTFTNKASEDMKRKIKELIGQKPSNMWMGTFHSICVRVLSQNLEELGYESGFVIYDQNESKALISDIIVTFDLDPEQYNPRSISQIINKAKQNLWTTSEIIDYYGNKEYYQRIAEIYEKYNETLQENNAFDFNDLIGKTIQLFQQNEDILEKYQERFKYVLIDEYQDTSPIQYQLARMLSKKHNNIFVVGDDYQSIYKFRGADMSNILDFSDDFDNCKVIKLERNYRCKSNIIEASNALIANNYNQFDKKAWTDNQAGEPVVVAKADDEYSEADYVVDEIDNLVRFSGYDYNDIAILYRSNHQSRILEEAFLKQRIPYYIVGGLGFYDRKEIKDIISYLKVAVNPQDTVALKRIVNAPKRGIGPKTIDRLITHAQEHVPEFDLFSFAQEDDSLGLFDVMKEPTQVSGIGKTKAAKIKKFHQTLEDITEIQNSNVSLPNIIKRILKRSGYQAMLELDDSQKAQTRLENLKEFLTLADNYYAKNKTRDLSDFLRDLRLFSDQDDLTEENQVKMMTVHAAKGLEFPVVFIVGVEEEGFPHYRSLKTGKVEDIEEERRLCYVAMTRAEDRLFMSYALERKKFGEIKERKPSRFLKELPSKFTLDKIHDTGF